MKKRNFLKSHHANLYKKSRYENPLFSHKKNKKSWKRYLIAPVTIFLFILIIWGLLAIPWLRIKTINVEGLVTIYPDSIEQSVWQNLQTPVMKIIPGDHIWFTRLSRLENALRQEFQLESIDVSKNGRTITIEATERITRAVWVTNSRMYFLDADGNTIRELSLEERIEVENQINTQELPSQTLQSAVFTIWDLNNEEIKLEQYITSGIIIETVDEFDELLRHSTSQPISYSVENKDEVWLKAKTTLGVDIYINGVGEAQEQFDNLQLIIEEYGESVHDLEYIDLRFGNRVYVK